MSRVRMFARILGRSVLVRPRRSLTAIGAIAVAAGIATIMLTLYADVRSKLAGEFQRFGSNLTMVAKPGEELPADALQRVDAALAKDETAAPFAFAAAVLPGGESVVAVGTDFSRARRLNGWWSVSTWPSAANQALVGARVARNLGAGSLSLTYGDRTIPLVSAGVLRTGAEEENRIYLDLQTFEKWTGLPPSVIAIRAISTPERIAALQRQLAMAIPQATVQPVRQITEAEATIFQKTRSTLLISVSAIVLTAVLCLIATLTSTVLERRKDFAVMKALGATHNATNAFFALEVGLLGLVGGVAGYLVGLGLAELIGWINFNSWIALRFAVPAEILGGSIAIALITSLLPLAQLRRLQPAWILKGE